MKQWNGENQGILSIHRPGSCRGRRRGKQATGANLREECLSAGESAEESKLAELNSVGKRKCGETPSVPTRKCNSVWPLPFHMRALHQRTKYTSGCVRDESVRGVFNPWHFIAHPLPLDMREQFKRENSLLYRSETRNPQDQNPDRLPSLSLSFASYLATSNTQVVFSKLSAMETNKSSKRLMKYICVK